MARYAKRCCSEVNENIFERIVNSAADAWRARAVASSIRPRSNSKQARFFEASRRVGMFRPKDLLVDLRSRFLKSGSALAYSPIASYSTARLLRLVRRVGMFRPKNLLPDLGALLVERFGFGVLAHRLSTARPGY